MAIPAIEQHYIENRQKLVKRMTFRAGEQWSAEDIVQEAYTRALMYWRSFDGSNLDRWLNTILNNTLREYQNSVKGITNVEFDEEEADGVSCSSYSGHVMAHVYHLIEKKSDVQKEILMLYFHQEYTAIDISRITPYTYSQIHQIIHRFRNELKEMYRE